MSWERKLGLIQKCWLKTFDKYDMIPTVNDTAYQQAGRWIKQADRQDQKPRRPIYAFIHISQDNICTKINPQH